MRKGTDSFVLLVEPRIPNRLLGFGLRAIAGALVDGSRGWAAGCFAAPWRAAMTGSLSGLITAGEVTARDVFGVIFS